MPHKCFGDYAGRMYCRNHFLTVFHSHVFSSNFHCRLEEKTRSFPSPSHPNSRLNVFFNLRDWNRLVWFSKIGFPTQGIRIAPRVPPILMERPSFNKTLRVRQHSISFIIQHDQIRFLSPSLVFSHPLWTENVRQGASKFLSFGNPGVPCGFLVVLPSTLHQ